MAEDKKIEVSEVELKSILEKQRAMEKELADLRQSNAGLSANQMPEQSRVVKRITDSKVRVKFVNNKPVVAYKNRGTQTKPVFTYEITDPNDKNKRILMVDLVLHGVKEVVPVDFNNFLLEAETREFVVKSERKEPWSIKQGLVKKREVQDYNMVETGDLVEIEVVGDNHFYSVEIDGDVIEFESAYVNIS
jgi:DNA-binding protein YbaB